MDRSFSPSLVQVFLEAASKKELIRLQHLNNLQNNKMFNYQNPIKDGKKWVTWYYADIFIDKPLNLNLEVDNGR